jgi:predicted MFS family arabinose efflux permease
VAPRITVDLAPLKESRDFRLLFAGLLVSSLGNQLTTVAIPFQVYALTRSSLQVGLVSLAQLVPLIVGSLVGGTVGDVVDRRTLIVVTAVASCLAAGGLVLNSLAAHPSLLVIYLVSALAAGLTGFASPARNAAIPMLVSPRHLVAAYSFNQIVFQLAVIVGPVIAGLLIASAGIAWTFGIDAASFVVMAVAALAMRPLPPEGGGQRAGLRSILDGFSFLRGRQVLQGVYLIDLNAMIFGMPRALFPAMAATVFHVGPTGLGMLYAAPAIGGLLGASTTGWVESIVRRGRAVVVAVALWGLAITLFGFTATLPVALVTLAIAGWADVISAVLRNTILQSSIPDAMRSRLSSFQMAVVQGGPRLGDTEAGAVAALTSTEISVISGGVACIIGAAVVARLLPRFWGERAGTPEIS